MDINTATPDDIPALCTLLTQLFQQEAEFAPDPDTQRRGLEKILSHPETGTILVARRNGDVIGMVNLLYTISTALGDRVALLEDMVVRPEFRNEGIGSELLAAAINHCRQVGCRRITLLTDDDNHGAQKFYQSKGFSLSAMVPMRLTL